MTDKRRTKGGNIRHSLSEILFVVFASVLCGYQDWEMMELFAKEQIDWFRKYYAYKRGIPSHDTIERLMASINPKEFNDCLQQWLQSIQKQTIRYYISSVQGKTAEQFNQLIRQHWAIENNLHWNLDVVFGEDKQRKRTKNMAQNMNLVLKTVMPLLKQSDKKISKNHKRNIAALNTTFREELLNF